MGIFNLYDVEFEEEKEIKEFLKVQYFGDILVDVKIQFNPAMTISDNDSRNKIALDMVNHRLQFLAGELAHEIRETLKKNLDKELK